MSGLVWSSRKTEIWNIQNLHYLNSYIIVKSQVSSIFVTFWSRTPNLLGSAWMVSLSWNVHQAVLFWSISTALIARKPQTSPRLRKSALEYFGYDFGYMVPWFPKFGYMASNRCSWHLIAHLSAKWSNRRPLGSVEARQRHQTGLRYVTKRWQRIMGFLIHLRFDYDLRIQGHVGSLPAKIKNITLSRV